MTVSLLLATGAVAAAAYEWLAVHSRKVPTISAVVMRLPVPARVAIVAAIAGALADHWITQWAL